jgi:hypothetical protein
MSRPRILAEVKADVKRLKEEQQKLRNMTDAIPNEVEQILFQEGWRIMNKSLRLAPIDYGLLRASARVELPERDGDTISIKLSYNTDYAKWVHEKNVNGEPVNYLAPGTRSHFLIDPIIENIDEMERRITKRLERMVRQNASR